MEFTHTAPLPVELGTIDLEKWIFGLIDDDYRACARGHHAMGVVGGAAHLGLVNVENIGGTLIVQHYVTQVASAGRVRFASPASEGFLLRAVPFLMSVWWEMTIEPTGPDSSQLCCSIGFETPGWVTAAGVLVRSNRSVQAHLVEETGGFARDIVRKHNGNSQKMPASTASAAC